MKQARAMLAAVVAAAILLSGCSGSPNRPVSGGVATLPVQTAKPLPTLTPTNAQPTPTPSGAEPTPTPSAQPPAGYSFPMSAAGLFGSMKTPDSFASPVYLSGDGLMFLYATSDKSIFKAQWTGAEYSIIPVAEGISAGAPASAFVDEQGGTLFCQGVRQYQDGSTGSCIVMVNLADGSRCNVDDYVGWKESGFELSPSFQCYGGLVLSQLSALQNGKYEAVDKWAIADIARRTYTVLDMAGFREKNLPQWHGIDAMELAIVGQNRLLAVCLAHGALPTATGGTTNKAAETCYAFLLDMNGNVLKTTALAADEDGSNSPAILGGVCVSASQDGKYLLYGSSAAPGVYLFDVDRGTETMIPGSQSADMAFAQWGKNGDIYYGLAGKAGGQVAIYQTSVDQVEVGK